MVAPCDKYQGLVYGPDGQTVADPYGMIPTLADYTEWREVARSILERANQQLGQEFEEHGALTEEETDTLGMLNAEWEEMGGWFEKAMADMNWSWGPSINEVVRLAQDAACELGVIEARRVAKGGDWSDDIPTPPVDGTTTPGKGKGAKGGGIGLVLLLGLVVAFAASRRQR